MRVKTIILSLIAATAAADTGEGFNIRAMANDRRNMKRTDPDFIAMPINLTPVDIMKKGRSIEDLEKELADKLARNGRKLEDETEVVITTKDLTAEVEKLTALNAKVGEKL